MRETTLCFGRFVLDLDRAQLHAYGEPVELPPLTFRVIRYLAANRGRTVSPGELREEIWRGLHVSEAALHQALRQARRALGDDGRRQAVIRTVRGGGYRFVPPVVFSRTDEAARACDVYVGRDALLAQLADGVDALHRGLGRVVLLRGPPGIGKTRTLAELERIALARGVPTARGGGHAHLGAPPFWPFVQVFRDLSACRPVEGLRRDVAKLAPTLLDPPSPESESGEAIAGADGVRFRLFDAVSRCLVHASTLGPLLVVLDDLHEAGGATLELLDFVAAELGRAPVLLAGAYRPGGPLCEGAAPLARLEGRAGVEMIELEGLGAADSRRLIELQPERPVALRVVDALARSARGNPLYLVELARLLGREAGAREGEEEEECDQLVARGAWRVMSERLAALGRPALEVLRLASVLGERVDRSLLEGIGGSLRDDTLEETQRLGLLVESGPSHLRFCHALVRETIYRAMPGDERRALHLVVAEAMLAGPEARLVEVAHHLAEAAPLGDLERTLTCLRQAGDGACVAFDFERARELYARGLGLLDRWPAADPALRCDLLIRAGEVAPGGDGLEASRALLVEAMGIARRHGWTERFCRAALSHAYASDYAGAARREVVAPLEEAAAGLGEGPPALRARLLSRLAIEVRYTAPGPVHAEGLIREALEQARTSGDPAVLARVLEDASFVRWSADDPDGWLELNREIVQTAEEARDYDLLFQGVKGLATAHMELGDRAAMDREIERCGALAEEYPAPYQRAAVESMRAAQAFLAGDFADAERSVLRALSAGLPGVTPLARVQLYYHRQETGRLGELEPQVRAAVQDSPDIVGWRWALARLLVELGRHEEAAREIDATGDLAEAPRDRLWLLSGAVLAESLVAIGDVGRARSLHASLRPYANLNLAGANASLFYGNVGHFAGMLAALLGRLDEADALLALAQRMHDKMRAGAWVLRTRLEQARVLHLRGCVTRASALSAEVRDEAEARGLASLHRHAALGFEASPPRA